MDSSAAKITILLTASSCKQLLHLVQSFQETKKILDNTLTIREEPHFNEKYIQPFLAIAWKALEVGKLAGKQPKEAAILSRKIFPHE